MRLNFKNNSTLHFAKYEEGITYNGPKVVGQFEMSHVICDMGVDGVQPWFVYGIVMARNYTNQVISTIFPTCLLWILIYFTMLINVLNFNNRFMGSVTFLLVLVTLRNSVNSSLPKTSYLKYIDL